MPYSFWRGERGAALMETLIAMVIMGIIAVAFSSGLALANKATIIADEQTTAESLAKSQMEWVKNTAYVHSANGYSPPAPSGEEYTNYISLVTAEPLHDPDDGIQHITITITRNGKELTQLQSYKVNR